MIEKMWEILTTLTDEARQAGVSKCQELSFDQNRGLISLDESYINLNSVCDILRDAIEKQKLIQLPITVQKELLASLEAISKHQIALIGGSDEVVNLTDAIEKLNTSTWRYGLHNLSGEVLGYQAKMNQLKTMELAASENARILQKGIQLKEQLQDILDEATKQNETLQSCVEAANKSLTATQDAFAKAEATSLQATESLTAIQQTQTSTTELLASSTASNAEIGWFEANIRTVVAEFTTLKGDLESNKSEQKHLFAEFEAHRNKINDLLGDANRTGMAASFTNRRRWLIAPMAAWISVFGFSIWGIFYMGREYIAPILTTSDWTQLPARIALTAPFIWLGWFAAKQYGYTSRLREDYAYKEASAKSFEGYKREAGQADPAMLKNLLETAIRNLGDNPIRIYNGHENHASPLHEILEKSLKNEKTMDLLKAIFAKAKG